MRFVMMVLCLLIGAGLIAVSTDKNLSQKKKWFMCGTGTLFLVVGLLI